MTVTDPTISNGSILGYTDAGVAAAAALGDVRLLEVRNFSIGKTVGLGVLITGVAVTAVVVVYCSTPDILCE